jgi:nitrate reductase alpha subunit
MAYDVRLLLKAAGAQTISTSGTAVDLGSAAPNKGQLMEFRAFWTALTGTTPTVDLIIEESADNTTFRQVTQFRQLVAADGTMTGINSTGRQMSRFGLVTQRYLRYRTVIGGTTPSITFSVQARGMDAVQPDVDRLTF